MNMSSIQHIELAESLSAQAATMYDGEDWQREQAALLIQRGKLHVSLAVAKRHLGMDQ